MKVLYSQAVVNSHRCGVIRCQVTVSDHGGSNSQGVDFKRVESGSMIYKRRNPGADSISVTFELPAELRDRRCSLVEDFNAWDPSADVFTPYEGFRITKEFADRSKHKFLYKCSDAEFLEEAADESEKSDKGEVSVIYTRVSSTTPMRVLGLNLSFVQEQLIGAFILILGFIASLYVFAIYLQLHNVNILHLLLLPVSQPDKQVIAEIISKAGIFDFISFQDPTLPKEPTYFALFVEIYTWCVLGILAEQAYKIHRDVISPGPVLSICHVVEWTAAAIARPAIAAVIILLIKALEITVSGHRLYSIGGVISIAFIAGFSGAFSNRILSSFTQRVEGSIAGAPARY